MPSGKQVLLALLAHHSQRRCPEDEADDTSERIRAGLLLHGSTPDDAWPRVDRMAWLTKEGVQGLGLSEENLFLVEVLGEILAGPMPERVKNAFPQLSEVAYADATEVLFLLVSQLYYFPGLASVENRGVLDEEASERLIESCRVKLTNYRRNPREFLGLTDEHGD